MFDAPYPFFKIGESKNASAGHSLILKTQHYRFNTESYEYHADVLCFQNSLYVVEFFLRADLKGKKGEKYGKLTAEYKMSRVVATCFHIMIGILEKDPDASFAFLGFPTYKNGEQVESAAHTARFIIYRYAMINLLGKQRFDIFEDGITSCFLVANKQTDISLIRQEANVILKAQF